MYVIAGLAIYLSMIIGLFYFVKKDPVISFCILFFLGSILPTSNVLFISSANFAERFLFIPSLSLSILVSYLIVKLTKGDSHSFNFRWKDVGSKIFVTLLLVFSVITIKGASYWKNNLTLFERGVVTSPNSSKTHYNLGQEYWRLAKESNSYSPENNYAYKAIEEFKKSISIFPENFMSVTNLACVYELSNQLDSSIYYFNASKKLNPDIKLIEANISAVFFKKATQFEVSKMTDSAEANYKIALQYNSSNSLASNNLALLYYNRNNPAEAITILKQAIKTDPKNISLIESIAAIFFLTQDYKSAIEFGSMGLNIDPRSKKIIGVLADANHALGNNDEVLKYQNMMNALR
jgi:tetratricopeptide (TPR) repeat protein